jgi:hypothetical protein
LQEYQNKRLANWAFTTHLFSTVWTAPVHRCLFRRHGGLVGKVLRQKKNGRKVPHFQMPYYLRIIVREDGGAVKQKI